VRYHRTALGALPSLTRDPLAGAQFVPGVTGVRFDTADALGPGMPGFRGEGALGTSLSVDGFPVHDPFSRSWALPVHDHIIDYVDVIPDPFSPRYGGFLGGLAAMSTRSGGDSFAGEVEFAYGTNAVGREERGSELSEDRDVEDARPSFAIGGPIVADSLSFFAAYDYLRRQEDFPAERWIGASFPAAAQVEQGDHLFAKLSLAPRTGSALELEGLFGREEQDELGVGQGYSPEARGVEFRDSDWVQLRYHGALMGTIAADARLGWLRRKITANPMSGDMEKVPVFDPSSGVTEGNWPYRDRRHRRRTLAGIDLTWPLTSGTGGHQLGAGVTVSWNQADRATDHTGDGGILFPEREFFADGCQFIYQGSQPALYLQFHDATLTAKSREYGVYVLDCWRPTPRLTVTAGVRADAQAVRDKNNTSLFSAALADSLAPRLWLAWELGAAGAATARFGAGRFYDVLPLAAPVWGWVDPQFWPITFEWGGPLNPTGEQLRDPVNWGRWYDRDGDGMQEFYPGQPRYQSDPSFFLAFDPDLKPPHHDRLLVEFEQKLGGDYAASARYVFGRTRELIDDVCYSIDEWQVMNFDRKRRDYHAVEAVLSGSPRPQLAFRVSYIYCTAEGTVPGQGELGDDGNWFNGGPTPFGDSPADDSEFPPEWSWAGLGTMDDDQGWYGPLPYAADHQINVLALWRAPLGIDVGAAFEWNSGYHWQAREYLPAYQLYVTFPEGRGARQLPAVYWLDLSLGKRFALGGGQSLGVRLEVFNVTDSDTPVAYDQEVVAGYWPGSFRPLKRQSPRTARISLTYSF